MSRAASSSRVGWGLADQSISSLTNFAVGIAVARTVSIQQFGAFALVFAAYSVVLGVSRALTTDPLVVRHSAKDPIGADPYAESQALGASMGVGLAAAVVCLVLSLPLARSYGDMLLALAVVIPGLVVQDAWRVLFFLRGKGNLAFYNDLVWALALLPAFILASRHPTAASMTLAWGAAGCLGAVFGLFQARLVPRLRQCGMWLRSNWDLSSRYLAESLLLTGSQQLYFFIIALLAGLGAVGQIRLVLVVLGPVNIVTQGVGIAALPDVVRAAHDSRPRLWKAVLAVSAVISTSAALWGVAVLLLPQVWLDTFVGPSWATASELVLPVMVLQILNGMNTGAYMGLRAMRQANRGLAIRIASSATFLVGAAVGASAAGAAGAAWGLVAAATINDGLWWGGYTVGERRWWKVVPSSRVSVA